MTWTDLDDLGEALFESHPEVDPLTVRFTDLLHYLLDLSDFEGNAEDSNEKKLEAVQMAWFDVWKVENRDLIGSSEDEETY